MPNEHLLNDPIANALGTRSEERSAQPTVSVLFFRATGIYTPISLLASFLTGRPWQKADDVPTHCALLFSWRSESGSRFALYESVVRGVQSLDWDESQQQRALDSLKTAIPLLVPQPGESLAFCKRCVERRIRYDWLANLYDGLLLAQRSGSVSPLEAACYNCTRFAAAALLAGGLDIGLAGKPLSPNCLMLALLERQRQAHRSNAARQPARRELTA